MHVRPVPKVSIFMAVTAKKVTEKAQKQAKMARFWPKTRHNGRVMAQKIFFHQCQWVTKFCAKFGHSRIPRTASIHNSFIVLRCMWKEPAPFHLLAHCPAPQGFFYRTLIIAKFRHMKRVFFFFYPLFFYYLNSQEGRKICISRYCCCLRTSVMALALRALEEASLDGGGTAIF